MIVLDPWSSHTEFDSGNDEHLLRQQVDENRREQSQVQVHGDNSTRGEELECLGALISLKLGSSHRFISALSLWVSQLTRYHLQTLTPQAGERTFREQHQRERQLWFWVD